MKNPILEELTYLDFSYVRAKDDGEGLKRGDIFIGERKIQHYPQIGRIFTLKEGIKRNFRGEFYVEEKFDGYNVRVFSHEGKLFAATRGGIICPFSTDRLHLYRDIMNGFFEAYPDRILVGELVGMHNPYMDAPTNYELKEEVGIRFFDVMEKDGSFLLPEERYEVFKAYKIPSVTTYGKFTRSAADYERLKEIVLSLNAKGREGIVLKSARKRGKYLKYVTPVINLKDIEQDAFLMAELPGNFYTSRIIRYVVSSIELGIRLDNDEKMLGKSLINGVKKAIQQYMEKGFVAKKYVIKFKDKRNVDEFLRVFRKASKHVRLKEIKVEENSEYYVLSFFKVFLDSTEKFRDYFIGKHLYD